MANTKISDFTSGAPAQSGDEFVIARSGANFKLAGSDIKTLVVGAGSVSVASAKTLTANNTLTLAGTDSTTMTFPSTSATLAGLAIAQTFTAKQTIDLSGEQLALGGTNTGVFSLAGSTSGKVTIQAANAAGTYTLTLPTSDGDAGQFLKTDGSGVLSWDAAGGGGTPGGSDTQIQYNNSGSFAGASGLTTNGTNLTLGSSSQLLWSTDLILTRRGTANLRFGAADAAAPVAQTLSVQSVVAGTSNIAGANLTITGSQGTGTGAGGSIIFQVAPAGSSGTAQNALVNLLEVTSTRRLSFYNTFTDATTFERANIFWDSNVLKIGTEKGSVGGNARALEFQTDGTTRLTLPTTGAATFISGVVASFYQLTNGSTLANIGSTNGAFLMTNSAVNDFNRLVFGGTTSSFPALKRSSASLIVRLADDTANAALESASLKTDAPTGGTSGTWKLGVAATVSPTSPNRTIEVDIGGTIYYLSAKTTND